MTNLLLELRERLGHTALAGTALLDEDFRLKRLLDDLAPLAEKNPVLGRIRDSLGALFEAAPAQRGGLLLTLLGLVDAVLYTGAGYGAAGELAALSENPGPSEVQQIPYSALHTLIEALMGKGSGRMKLLDRAIAEHHTYFGDFRVIRALVFALADTSDKMTARVFQILQALAAGQSVSAHGALDGNDQERCYPLPQADKKQMIFWLKRGFDPEGKADMVRRLMLVSQLAGAEENDWYLSLLDTDQKEIRALAIFSLGYQKDNIPLLFELTQKERSKAKEMAYRALAQLDTPEVLAFWEKLLDQDAKYAVYLSGTTLDAYGDMVAERLRSELEKVLDQPKMEQFHETASPYIAALMGKASAGVIRLYAWILTERARIPWISDFRHQNTAQNSAMLCCFHEKICGTLVLCCPPALVDFLQQTAYADVWGKAYFFADLLTLSAAEVYEKWSGKQDSTLYQWLQELGCNGQGERMIDASSGALILTEVVEDVSVFSLGSHETLKRAMKEPFDLRWLDVLMRNDWEDLFGIIDDHALPEAWRKRVGAYFYQQALQIKNGSFSSCSVFRLHMRLRKMNRYGWQTYDDVLVNLCRSHPKIPEEQLSEAFAYYRDNAGEENTFREAQQVLEFYRTTPEYSERAEPVLTMLKDNGFLKEA